MSIHESLFSNRSEDWPTPQAFYDALNDEFDFSLDPCASRANAKCKRFFTKDDDGLSRDWGTHRVFCNPPYGRKMRDWARKCFDASQRGATVVLLAHARTDTQWFHHWVYGKAAEIRFVKGRLKFGDGTTPAPFPSLVAVFRPRTIPAKSVILKNAVKGSRFPTGDNRNAKSRGASYHQEHE